MKKALGIVMAAVLCAAVFAGCAGGGSGKVGGTLNFYSWEGMFPPEVLDAFTEETGITINYSNFDYGEAMLTRLQANDASEYDLVIVDDYILEIVIEEGLAKKLDKSKISTLGNINPIYKGQFYDPSDEYTVPYGAGVQTIMYNPAAVNIPIRGYADLWDASLADQVGTISNHRVINGMALKVIGESYNTEDPGAIRRAGDRLVGLAPNIRIIKDDAIHTDLMTGEINAAVMYTSQVTMAKMEMPELEIVFPVEGIGFGIMAGFIPANAPNADAAYKFLDFLGRPEVAAEAFEWLGYYCTNLAAEPFIDDDFKAFLTLPEGFNLEMEMIQNVGQDALDLHNEIWIEFRNAAGQPG
ncbi:MAG: spermidine/putrescine ABC transporter substrate-binding protein [Oscillospiraceae bacterium]|nr:spermidine/putrescine ABC transporter substrate-binding protein [Oscillospiraceae bacterium]